MIKEELLEEIKNKLKDYTNEINDITAINSPNTKSYLGNIKLFDVENIDTVNDILNDMFNVYGEYSLNSRKINSCCSPTYILISFKLNMAI
ncbi:MAG: hypothetical protein LBM26_03875 [Methanobrevibacter sp.]|jgi:hypothetical protein|nr:hypothetical protein [Methanobrevibacter sp.]